MAALKAISSRRRVFFFHSDHKMFVNYLKEAEGESARLCQIAPSLDGSSVFFRGRKAELEVGLLKKCLPHITDMLREFRVLEEIHASFARDGFMLVGEGDPRGEASWMDLIHKLEKVHREHLEEAMYGAFQMLQLALEKVGSKPISVKAPVSRKSVSCGDENVFLGCREVTAHHAVGEIEASCKAIQYLVRQSGVILFRRDAMRSFISGA